MLDLDQRVTDGLRELAGRTPLDYDVWPATEARVGMRRRMRRALAGGGMAAVLVVGGLTAVAVTRAGGSKAVVANPGAVVGTFTITAAPTGGLTYGPASISVRTGLYDLTFTDGANAQHTLYFDDPATLWPGLVANELGERKTARIFFGKAGNYTFYCAVPGHRVAGMQGVVHVTGPDLTLAQAEADARAN